MTFGQSTVSEVRPAVGSLTASRRQIMKALENKALAPIAEGVFGFPLLNRLLEGLDKLPAPTAVVQASAKPTKTYSYARVRVKRCDGFATTVSLNEPFYKIHCEVLGRKRVHAIIREAAFEADFRARPPTLSAKIRTRLIARARALIGTGALRDWYERRLTPLLPAPPKPKCTPHERYLKYKGRSGYGKTYKTVGAPVAKRAPRTALSVGLTFYGRACAILGKDEVHRLLRHGSRTYMKRPDKTRSEHARERVVAQIQRLSKQGHSLH